MEKSVFLKQDPDDSLWSHEQQIQKLLADQQVLEKNQKLLSEELAALGPRLENLGGDEEPPHPYGLCGDVECESCVQAGQKIVTAARARLLDEIDQALVAATDGKEDLKERVAQALQLGQAKLQQSAVANKK